MVFKIGSEEVFGGLIVWIVENSDFGKSPSKELLYSVERQMSEYIDGIHEGTRTWRSMIFLYNGKRHISLILFW